MIKRSQIWLCPFFRFELYNYQEEHYIGCYCNYADDVFIDRRIKKEEPSNKELRKLRKMIKEVCSFECPKFFKFLDEDETNYDFPDFDESLSV